MLYDRNIDGRARIYRASRGWLAAVLLVFAGCPAHAGNIWLPDGATVVNVPAASMAERKFSTIVRQQYDFSCGSAALATLLTYHYDDMTSEQEAFAAMYEKGDAAKIQQLGFSLLDIKSYLETKGYEADGYKTDLATLGDAGVPAIALINVQGYKHFVVVKGLENGEVMVGDPALGLRYFTADKFNAMWENGILFIIRNRSEVGRQYFNADREWRLLARAPLGEAVDRRTLESLTISLPGRVDVAL